MNKRTFNYLTEPSLPCSKPLGERTKKVFELITNGNNLDLKYISSFDIPTKIQSYHDSCCLASMIKKFELCGDPGVLHKKQPFYGDITGIASDAQEYINDVRSAYQNVASVQNAVSDVQDPITDPGEVVHNESEVKVNAE